MNVETFDLVGRELTLPAPESGCGQPTNSNVGLSNCYAPRTIDSLSQDFVATQSKDSDALARIAEECSAPFQTRFAAGVHLALRGDPRIDVRNPAMVFVPGGEVEVGTTERQARAHFQAYRHLNVQLPWLLKEVPRYRVEIRGFCIGKYLVTNGEFRQFLLETNYPEVPTSWRLGSFPWWKANAPVYTVSKPAAIAFARWLRLSTGRLFRLPTEAEWEYAGAGPQGSQFPWGNEFLPDHANTAESGVLESTPVGLFPRGASFFGALDMAGNVEELVADDYAPYVGGQVIEDDLWEVSKSYPICRGGSFARFRDLARCQRRHGPFPSDLYPVGFRLAETLLSP